MKFEIKTETCKISFIFYILQADYETQKWKPSHNNATKRKSNLKSDDGDNSDYGDYFNSNYYLIYFK